MKNAVVLLCALLAAACAHGRTGRLPPPPEASEAAHVVVIRNDNLFDWGISVKVKIDEVVVAHIRAGERVDFRVAPGLHRIAITDSEVPAAMEKGQTYYYLISADDSPSGFEIERLDSHRAQQWLTRTTPLP
jgi:hypothetical protein